jgi:drug/metabolite transporter (DMT)-like permease
MLAFAGNSLLCRLALKHTAIDPASFTTIRIVSGTLMLGLILRLRVRHAKPSGSWRSAFALFVYATAFSFAYVGLTAATGALLLFGAVQATMIGNGLWRGERLSGIQKAGLVLALAGLVALLLPGLSAPPLPSAGLMLTAGAAWGVYSLRGKGGGDPLAMTAGNFLRALAFAALLSVSMLNRVSVDGMGAGYAASGALASGIGYAIWYSAVPGLNVTSAATVQLSVPVLAAAGGVAWLGEPLTVRLALSATAVLAGIALVIVQRARAPRTPGQV